MRSIHRRLAESAGAWIPAVAAFVLVAFVYGLHVFLTFQYRYLNPFSNAEEWAYTNIAANNFIRFGFLNSLFLQDFSPSPYPEDHPFVYNHMPAGPDNATALMLLATGHDYQLTRFLFALPVLPGIYYFVRFSNLLLGLPRLGIAALTLFTFSPVVLLSHMEAQIHSVFLLLGFAPLVWLIEHARGGAGWRIWAAGTALFVLSIYVQYMLVAGIVFALIYLWLLRLDKLRFLHVLAGVGAIAAGVGLHLVQNFIYFGPELFFRELAYTVGNRTVGIPSKEDLKAFYQSIAVVHHGSRAIDPEGFTRAILRNLRVPQAELLAALLLASLAAWLLVHRALERGTSDSGAVAPFWRIVRMYCWSTATVVSVLMLFPAFAQEVNLGHYGVNHMLLGIPTVALLLAAIGYGPGLYGAAKRDRLFMMCSIAGVMLCAIVLRFLWGVRTGWTPLFLLLVLIGLYWPRVAGVMQPSPAGRGGLLVHLGVYLLAAISATALLRSAAGNLKGMYIEARQPSFLEELVHLQSHAGRLFMTNINLPTVGFFAGAPGYGVCELDAVRADGKIAPDQCRVAYMRRERYWLDRQPELFYFFSNARVFPGFSDCMPPNSYLPAEVGVKGCIDELRTRLKDNYRLLERRDLYEVYDLSRPARP